MHYNLNTVLNNYKIDVILFFSESLFLYLGECKFI
jgi:hypothetical protein